MSVDVHANERGATPGRASPSSDTGPGVDGSRPSVLTGENEAAWQSIWFELRQHAWRTLAFVPVDDTQDVKAVCEAIAMVARRYEREPIRVMDATALTLEASRVRLDEMERLGESAGRVLMALDPPLAAPVALPVARATDAAVLVVRLEATGIQAARDVVDRVGASRFIGSITLKAQSRRARRRTEKARKARRQEGESRASAARVQNAARSAPAQVRRRPS
jgi:hypothetical protein